MNSTLASQRKKAVAAALASVRAEGLAPSNALKKRLAQYASGKITANQVRRETLNSAKVKSKHAAR